MIYFNICAIVLMTTFLQQKEKTMWLKIIERLQNGEDVTVTCRGGSMTPLIKVGKKITISPVDVSKVEKGDIVVATVKGRVYDHLVTAATDHKVQISNNHGHVNGWTSRSKIHGIVTKIGDKSLPKAVAKTIVVTPAK